MAVNIEDVKALRERTGISVAECKKALEKAEGDMDKALEFLRERSAEAAAKKQDRTLGAGTVATYTHGGCQVGAIVLLSCETDFVSKNEEFVALARDIAMQAAAMRASSVEELLTQEFIKDPSRKIADLLAEAVHKFGERTEIGGLAVLSVR